MDTDKTVEIIFIDSWCALTLAIKVNDLHVRMLDNPRTIDLFQSWYACMQGDVQSLPIEALFILQPTEQTPFALPFHSTRSLLGSMARPSLPVSQSP